MSDSRTPTPQEPEQDNNNNITPRRARGSRVTVEDCDEVFCFLADFGVLICKQHATAVTNLVTHLLQHHDVPSAAGRLILERFCDFPVVAPDQLAVPGQWNALALVDPLSHVPCSSERACSVAVEWGSSSASL